MTRLIELMLTLEARGNDPADFTPSQISLYFHMSRSEATRFLAAWRLLHQ